MNRLKGLFGGGGGGGDGAAKTESRRASTIASVDSLQDERAQLLDASRFGPLIMSDEFELAEKAVEDGDSPFHKLASGNVAFMQALLGLEQTCLKKAYDRLNAAEAAASEHYRRATRDRKTSPGRVYPPGTEYAFVQASVDMQRCVVGVVNASLTESLKAFYRIRRAYATLESISQNDTSALKRVKVGGRRPSGIMSRLSSMSLQTRASFRSRQDSFRATTDMTTRLETQTEKPDEEDGNSVFHDADEGLDRPPSSQRYAGHIANGNGSPTTPNSPVIHRRGTDTSGQRPSLTMAKARTNSSLASVSPLHTDPVDIFTFTGTCYHFGMLLLMLSLIPPSLTRLLSVIGFRGDRERGIQLLWDATLYDNYQSAMAGLLLLTWYSGFVTFMDIRPANALPRERCRTLFDSLHKRYPKSGLLLLEEARSFAANKQLAKAVEVLEKGAKSPVRQLEGYQWYDHAMHSMALHDYQAASDSFRKSITMNSWSHGLYLFIAACSHVELYRCYKYNLPLPAHSSPPKAADGPKGTSNEELLKYHADKAESIFKEVSTQTGKQKLFGRLLPFDIFINRKLAKWAARAKAHECRLVDGIGISPIEEMIFFSGGYNFMDAEDLQVSLQRLAWSDTGTDLPEGATTDPHWDASDADERAVLAVLRATVWRHAGRCADARALLLKEVVKDHKLDDFRGGHKDNWTPPSARYGVAVCLWMESNAGRDGQDGGVAQRLSEEESRDKLRQCKALLEEVANWEAYDLDSRFGLKISVAVDTVTRVLEKGKA